MKNAFVAAFTVAACVGSALAQVIQINTPFQTPDANGQSVQQYFNVPAPPFIWQVNISANTQYGISIHDSQGNTGQSGPFIVQPGSTNCLSTSGSSAPAPGSSGASTPAASSASTGASSTGPSGSSSTGAPSGSSSTNTASSAGSGTSASTSPSPTSNSALINTVAMGAVGFIGAVVAAIVA
ncbi:hypothetical protein PHLCEN_2v9022 [Hermanssonia centrifuga]|uniref:Uncharacterized protein n=1 Tax=Hermanssonia centrifuga TaxID=98765 RepID=A0A2R6NRV6_9APHY|nr:hypothetical protein PHLCEN_2v9022 [Hermanssonia centrifuga]